MAEKYQRIWLDVGKVIDPLHLANHKRDECKTLYNPNKLKDICPEANLMVSSQLKQREVCTEVMQTFVFTSTVLAVHIQKL